MRLLILLIIALNIFAQELTNINKLTLEEISYLNSKKELKLCIGPDSMPFEDFGKNGEHIGLTSDYYKIFSKNLNIPINIVAVRTWKESLDFAKDRTCDIISAMQTDERKQFLNFTSPYLKTPVVIATNNNGRFISDFKDLTNEKIGVPKSYAYVEILKKIYPNINYIEVPTIKDGLKKVINGELYGQVGTLASIGYFFTTDFAGSLKIAGKTDKVNLELGIGVRNDDPILLEILQNQVNNIDESFHNKVLNNWINIKYNTSVDYSLVYKILFIIFIIACFLIYKQLLLNKYNKKLEKDVEEKTKNYKIKNDELINSNQNFFDLLNTAIEAIAIFDEEYTLVKLNASGKIMFNYYFDNDSDSKKISDFIPENSLTEVNNKLKHKISEPFEIDLYRSDKTIFPALIAGKTILIENKVNTIITVVDLTQIKLQDEFIQQQAKLAQMGELLSMIAHQWRQPLTAISAASENLKLKTLLNQVDTLLIQTTTEDINKYTTYLSNTINDFKNFYKTNKALETTTLNEMVIKSLYIIENSISYKNIKIIKNLDSTSILKTYMSEVTQVILTLLQNAEEILIEKNIENPYIKIDTFEDNKYLYIQVSDNAGGIPLEIFDKIFDPYFSTKHEKNGTGLGLYFAKNIIENNCNALLSAKNNLNEAVFTISFKKE
ncbi:transporter substrate-binding domain-containing protein [Arcobacter sp. s6]|uniref:transporter substrate-binding domain-containing protein n=1 Tax=Arcobacter sp. s6 TaxID=3230363 RepID=UPI00349FEFF5